ncbi:HCR009Cp [Eremothecium sinecaudum]|uniref:Kinesin-like protein n=1 Tax=Eremothecium sinecaudum TaxID=45286 RepID=A0A0X8HRK0_9SACH|nr:HCR009Cp [Eremothecium sinecaudum]AMD20159.1 HCR009Cp [Eremothecium sinecaudum]
MVDNSSEELNITVAVRCRGRNEREIKAKSAVVVTVPDVKGSNEVSINTSGDVGIAAKMNARTYTVDKVFGPSADQHLIFKDIAEPLFEDFIKGYNCTMLVYGMTSTGKTYTMTGDEKLYDGELSDAAGIIPRILFKLFDVMKATDCDYMVKCSYIELYNEELKDLLVDMPDSSKRLRIFDSNMSNGSRSNSQANSPVENETSSTSKRRYKSLPTNYKRLSIGKQHQTSAIHIQNLQEFHITNACEGIKILQKGLKHRQVASTKMNDVSSRSHTIFTIMLYKNYDGELFRMSKMNLVDLAGSENINRSGAQNLRAKEAGSINQSLLTLGRVINSLADKNIHIPFRESKLTRLLQDSLGGNTKTALIATISPAKINADETSSTLEYASKAKNIMNRPQLGSYVMKEILVKNISKELSKLKSDFLSTKSKDGIYMSHEHYQELINDLENYKTEIQESKRQGESLVSQNALLLKERKTLQEVNDMQQAKTKKLQHTIDYLQDKIERQHHNEIELVNMIQKLRDALHTMQGSLKLYETHEQRLQSDIKEILFQGMTSYRESMEEHLDSVKLNMLDKDLSIEENLDSINSIFNSALDSIQSGGISMCEDITALAMRQPSLFYKQINSIVSELKTKVDGYSEILTNKLTEMCEENNNLNEYLGEYLFKNNNFEMLDLKLQNVYEEVKISSQSLISNFASMLEAHVEQSKTLLVNSMKDTVSEMINSEKTLFQPVRERWVSSFENLNQCDSIHQKFQGDTTKLVSNLEVLADDFVKDSGITCDQMGTSIDNFKELVQKLSEKEAFKKQISDLHSKHKILETHFDNNIRYFKESSKGFEEMDYSIKRIINEMNIDLGDVHSVEMLLERISSRSFGPIASTGKTPIRQILRKAPTVPRSRSMSPIKNLNTNVVHVLNSLKRSNTDVDLEGSAIKKVK